MSKLTKRMKALMVYAPGDYRLEEVDVPRAEEQEIIIKVNACGVCGSDIKVFHGAANFWGGSGNPSYVKAPVIPGHEFYGTVAELGANVKGDFKIGDTVIPEQIVPCWECRFCKTGRYWMCQKHDMYGFQNNVNGGMAEYTKLPKESLVYKIPDHVPMKSAVLIEPFACSKHAVDRANITNEDIVVLSGSGTLGLGMVGAIKMKNPKVLVVLDLKDNRLELAKKFGADIILNPAKENIIKKILEMTDGYGCDVYIEASANPASVQQGLECIRKLGRFVEFSVFGEMVTVDWSIISDRKELDILGGHIGPYCYEPVIEWIATGKLPTKGVVTHKFELSEWKQAFKMAENPNNSIKVVIVP